MLTTDLLLSLQHIAALPLTGQPVYMPPPGVSLLDCQTVLAGEGYEYLTVTTPEGFVVAGFVHTHHRLPLATIKRRARTVEPPAESLALTPPPAKEPTISQKLKTARAKDRAAPNPTPPATPKLSIPRADHNRPAAHIVTVRSDSDPSKSYSVGVDDRGRALRCGCTAGQNRTPCRHLYRAEVKHAGVYQAARAHLLHTRAFPSPDAFDVAFAARSTRDGMNTAIAWVIASAFPGHDLATVPAYPRQQAEAHATATLRATFTPTACLTTAEPNTATARP